MIMLLIRYSCTYDEYKFIDKILENLIQEI